MTTNVIKFPRVPVWTFADRVRKIRRESGLGQAAFAEKLGFGDKALGQWETGRSKPEDIVEVARRIQREFGVPAAWVLGLDDAGSTGPGDGGGNQVTREYGCLQGAQVIELGQVAA